MTTNYPVPFALTDTATCCDIARRLDRAVIGTHVDETSADSLLGHDPGDIIVGPGGQTLTDAAADEQADEPYVASLTEALKWARTADAGEYLVEYEDTGMTDVEDPGSRCGYSDADIAAIEQVLGSHDLRLVPDDRGLVAQAVRS